MEKYILQELSEAERKQTLIDNADGVEEMGYTKPMTQKSTDLTMTLVSPEAADIVHKSTKDIIQDELKKIGETCPDLVIIEQ